MAVCAADGQADEWTHARSAGARRVLEWNESIYPVLRIKATPACARHQSVLVRRSAGARRVLEWNERIYPSSEI